MIDHTKWAARTAGAQWIWHDIPRTRNDTALFFHPAPVPRGATTLRMWAAGHRYTLWATPADTLPGLPVSRGSARGDIHHTSLDPCQIPVRGGVIHLWAMSRWMPGQPEGPMGEIHPTRPGFLLLGEFVDRRGKVVGRIATGRHWLASPSNAIEFTPMPRDIGYLCIGMAEHVTASGFTAGWHSPRGPKAGADWRPAAASGQPYLDGDPNCPWGPGDRPWLIERAIPPMEQIVLTPRGIHEAGKPAKLPARAPRKILIDLGELRLVYPRFTAAAGTRLAVRYGEVLAGKADGPTAHPTEGGGGFEKSFDPASAWSPWGYGDRFTFDAAATRTLAPSHWRAFRFLEITVEAGRLDDVHLEATGYPLTLRSRFQVTGPHRAFADALVDVSWRTLRNCAWETYMDCPYYEQMQYVGDTRIMALATYVGSGDPQLPAQAIRAFDRSRMPDGLTESRAPSNGRQIIPTWSMLYVSMVEDYAMWVGQADGLVRQVAPGIAPIIDWCTRFTTSTSPIMAMPAYWGFVDWVHGWHRGVPPAGQLADGREATAALNLHYLMAMQSASRVLRGIDDPTARRFATQSRRLAAEIRHAFFDTSAGLISDVPTTSPRRLYSQHAQALAAITGVLSRPQARHALGIVMDESRIMSPGTKTKSAATSADVSEWSAADPLHRISPASFYFRFYLAEALVAAGMGDRVFELLAPFRDAINNGSTTWPECFEPSRSECHAWGSWPLYFFHRHVLGVTPTNDHQGGTTLRPTRCAPWLTAQGTTLSPRARQRSRVDWR